MQTTRNIIFFIASFFLLTLITSQSAKAQTTGFQVSGKVYFSSSVPSSCSVPTGATVQNNITVTLSGNGINMTQVSGVTNPANPGSFYFNNVPNGNNYQLCMNPGTQGTNKAYCVLGGATNANCKLVSVNGANMPGNHIVMIPNPTNTPVPPPSTGFQVSGKVYYSTTPPPSLTCSIPTSATTQNNIILTLTGNGFYQKQVSGLQNPANPGSFYMNNVPNGTYQLCMDPNTQGNFQFYCAVGALSAQCKNISVSNANNAGNNVLVLPPQVTSGPTVTPNPTITGVACTTEFTDVPQSDPFYVYIHCLACRNVISGYADGTFRPGNPVTRGQMSKIITSSAGFNETIPTNTQTFADVTNTNTFWVFVERAYSHGLISGYACGGAGEPCDANNRPYFRPGNNLTRSQGAKMVVLAKAYNDAIPANQQTFADVPSSSPFYIYIERAAMHGLISGYACGGAGEPCDANNRPYFRVGNDLTRAQASKIVTVAFFPSCVQTQNPVHWTTSTVDLSADDFYIMANGKKYTSKGAVVNVHSDPGSPTYTTLELIWHENGDEMRLFIYFKADGQRWWSEEMRTYNGAQTPDWNYYRGKFFDTALGQTFTGNIDMDGSPQGHLYIHNLRLQAFSIQSDCVRKREGDADCNGTIDLSDFELWRQEFTIPPGSDQPYFGKGDFNADGKTDLADFEIWRATFTSGNTSQ